MRPAAIRVLLSVMLLLLAAVSYGQSNPLDKKLQKAYTYLKEDKYDDADEYLEKLLKDNPGYGDGWDLLAQVRYKLYEDSKAKATRGIKITTKDKDGNDVRNEKNDSLINRLTELLNRIDPSKKAYNKFLYTLRKATLLSREAHQCASLLRILEIDTEVDSNVSKKALGYFQQGEKEFAAKNYNKAALLYKRALEEQPDFYKASLYLGDCFYITKYYAEAVTAFKASIEKFPYLVEPRKYLVDAYANLNLHQKVVDESISSFSVYPDLVVSQRFEDALYMMDKRLDIKPVQRGVLPNKIKDTVNADMNEYYPKEPDVKGVWKYYVDAGDKARLYYNEKGMLKMRGGDVVIPYLELYSWEQMLNNTNDPSLAEAKRMQKDGYLDCYVLVSNFHYDIYDQYHDFVGKNKEKLARYYQKYIVYK